MKQILIAFVAIATFVAASNAQATVTTPGVPTARTPRRPGKIFGNGQVDKTGANAPRHILVRAPSTSAANTSVGGGNANPLLIHRKKK